MGISPLAVHKYVNIKRYESLEKAFTDENISTDKLF